MCLKLPDSLTQMVGNEHFLFSQGDYWLASSISFCGPLITSPYQCKFVLSDIISPLIPLPLQFHIS